MFMTRSTDDAGGQKKPRTAVYVEKAVARCPNGGKSGSSFPLLVLIATPMPCSLDCQDRSWERASSGSNSGSSATVNAPFKIRSVTAWSTLGRRSRKLMIWGSDGGGSNIPG